MKMSPTIDTGSAVHKISDFIQILVNAGGLDLKPQIITLNDSPEPGEAAPSETQDPAVISVDLSGDDIPLLLAHNGELLHAIEHIAAKILRLEPENHDQICFDTVGYKASRDRSLELSARVAVQSVHTTGLPYSFSPMTSRERRLLHLILKTSGLTTASSGEGPRRFVILYPEGQPPKEGSGSSPSIPSPDRIRSIRNRFRPR
jgi:spoIIIJ-associated protein